MAISIVAMGSSKLPKTDNDYASVTVKEAGATLGDIVIITPTSALPKDLKYNHSIYVSEVDGDGFTVKSSFVDLPDDVTFDYIIVHEAA